MVNHVETKYGKSILAGELQALDHYVLITNDAAWELCGKYFHLKPPIQVIMVETLDKECLDDIYNRVSGDLEIVGLGGGTALDAAKYFAYLNGKTPLLVASITSTNAPFTDFISIRKNGGPFGFKVDGYPKKIIIDYELISLADQRLNRAGFGDLMYMQTTLNDWRIMHQKGVGPVLDINIQETILQIINTTIKHAFEIGSITETGIRILMESTELSSELYMQNLTKPIGAGSEHLFAWNLELLTNKPLVHGEIVSLGIVISSFLQSSYLTDSSYREVRKALDDAQVTYHPDEIGVTWNEIEETLLTVEEYNRKIRNFHTVFELTEWTPALFKRIKRYIYS